MQSKGIQTAAKVMSKIIEIFFWIGAVIMAAAAVCSLVKPTWLKYLMSVDTIPSEQSLRVCGFEMVLVGSAGQINYPALCMFSVVTVILFALVAFAFHQLSAVIKAAETGSPFQNDNIARLKQIGYACFALPVVGLVASIIARLLLGAETSDISIDLSYFAYGVMILCLTQYFIYGAKLEADTEGLL